MHQPVRYVLSTFFLFVMLFIQPALANVCEKTDLTPCVNQYLIDMQPANVVSLAQTRPNETLSVLIQELLVRGVSVDKLNVIYAVFEHPDSSLLRAWLGSSSRGKRARRILMQHKIERSLPRQRPWQKELFLSTWGYRSVREARFRELESVIHEPPPLDSVSTSTKVKAVNKKNNDLEFLLDVGVFLTLLVFITLVFRYVVDALLVKKPGGHKKTRKQKSPKLQPSLNHDAEKSKGEVTPKIKSENNHNLLALLAVELPEVDLSFSCN